MATGKRLVFHGVTLTHHVLAMLILARVDWTSSNNAKLLQIHEFSHRFFTTWNFIFQMVYLTCALVCDVGDIKPELVEVFWPRHQLMRRCAVARDIIFSSIVFPCSIMVASMFWAVFFYDRELVMPYECDLVLPPMVNHCIHSNILLVLPLELMLGNGRKPRLVTSLLGLGVVIVTYYTVLLGTYYLTGRWIYNIFYLWDWTERVIFLCLNAASLYLLLFVGSHAQELTRHYLKQKQMDMADHQNGDLSNNHSNGPLEIQKGEVGDETNFDPTDEILRKLGYGEENNIRISELKCVFKKIETFGTLD